MEILRSVVKRTGTDDLIALILIGVSAYLYLSGGDIPDSLLTLTTIIVGFFFGKKYTENTAMRTIQAVNPAPPAPYINEDS